MTKGRSLAAPTQECSRAEPADARGNQRAIAEEFGLVIPGERDVLPYVWGSESNKKVPAIKKKWGGYNLALQRAAN